MRRVPALVTISRRDFCSLAGAVGMTALAGCIDGDSSAIQTGALGGGNGGPPPDGGTIAGPDASTAAVCTGTPTDVGPPSMFAASTPVYFSSLRFFVVRDAAGIYALTARCTHEGVTCAVSSGKFRCPRHGALFTFDGAVVSGPVSKPLVHYATCLLPNGNVGVSTAMVVASNVRLVA
jgi:nitrite reductase/ring-hydroxylating ferredoxin subunit